MSETWAEFVQRSTGETLTALMPRDPLPATMEKAKKAVENQMLEAIAIAINNLLPPILEAVVNEFRVMQDQIEEIWEVLGEEEEQA